MALGGRYRLVRQIAVGGMGEVWVAHDESLARDVAVKVLREEFAGNSDFLDRLRTEARNSAALSHSNIAQLYDYGEQQGSGYLVMELVQGEPMSDLLEREPVLPVLRLLSILSQTARALHAAHVAGVVHRDVKPGNILLERSGEVKITDFGVSLAANQIPMTAAGMVMGTAQYLSPEQAIGKAATGASDIYALGIVAYESIVGNRPFTGATPVDIAVAQVNETVPPLPATVHTGLADLVMRMLAKDPLDRPRSGAILARTFDLLADEIAADPWGNGRRRRDPEPAPARREAPPTAGLPTTAPAAPAAPPAAALSAEPAAPVAPAVPLPPVQQPGTSRTAPPAPPVAGPEDPETAHGSAPSAPVGRRMLPAPSETADPQHLAHGTHGAEGSQGSARTSPEPTSLGGAGREAHHLSAEPAPQAPPARARHDALPPPPPADEPTRTLPQRQPRSAPEQRSAQWEPQTPVWDAVDSPRRSPDAAGHGQQPPAPSEQTGAVRRRVPHTGATDRARTSDQPRSAGPRSGLPRTPAAGGRTGASASPAARGRSGSGRPGRGSSSSRRRGAQRRGGLAGFLDTVRSVGWPTLALVLVLVVVLTATLAKALLDSSGSEDSSSPSGDGHLSETISVESTGGTGTDAMIVQATGSQSRGAASPTTPKDT